MLVKGTIAATVLAATLAFMPAAATAKTKIHIGIGAGSDYCFHRPYSSACRFGHGYGYGYNYGYGYGYGYGYYHPPIGYYAPHYYQPPRHVYRISCGQAKEIVRDHGYRNVRTRDCGGRINSFIGRKSGHLWLVRVDTRSGRISRSPL